MGKSIKDLSFGEFVEMVESVRPTCVLKEKHGGRIWWMIYLENKLLLISITFTPKTSHSCLKKWYTMFSRLVFNQNFDEKKKGNQKLTNGFNGWLFD